MSKAIIETYNLGKKYLIHNPDKKAKKRRSLKQRAKAAFSSHSEDEVWAIRDINISVEQGDIVAVHGGNGSGKSTLFRLLSEITDPSEGEIILRSSVSCMLEAGVGFNNELTGKENIYLNGTLLGMTKQEIDAQFDEIVAFSELEKYLGVPIKKYSSGMYVRLAFAVASFLRTDILLVDEVLSVSVESFRKKSIDRMKQMAKEGCTIMMVSHDVNILKSLCHNAIHMDQGKMITQGSLESIITNANSKADE
jgi:ABC-type polysaccharide/polyol phosphate transport system, ATPase component